MSLESLFESTSISTHPLVPKRHSSLSSQMIKICTVSALVPPFWTSKPELWFHHLDSLFHRYGIICDATKFEVALKAVEDEQLLAKIADIVLEPFSTGNKYDKLKERLITHLNNVEVIDLAADSDSSGAVTPISENQPKYVDGDRLFNALQRIQAKNGAEDTIRLLETPESSE